MGNRWAVCVAVGAPGGYGDADCGMASEGRLKFKVLELDFDDAGIVADKDTSTIIEGECERSDICDDDGLYVVYDLDTYGYDYGQYGADDRETYGYDDASETCDIYVFVESNEDFSGDQVLMDGVLVGYLGGPRNYLNLRAPVGQYDIRPSFESSTEKPHVVFECEPGERTVFLMQASGRYEYYLSREFVNADDFETILDSQLIAERVEYSGN